MEERLAPTVKAQPNRVVLDLIDGLFKGLEGHEALDPVDGADPCVTQGTMELADVSGVYFPFVRLPAWRGNAPTHAGLHTQKVSELFPGAVPKGNPSP